MDLITNLSIGFGVAFTPINLLYCFIGCLLGTLVGVLPGIGPVATIAMLLPATYALAARVGADHAGRHLLRRAVRRLHHRHPGEPAGGIVLGRDGDRRLPDGKAGPRGPGACGRGPGLVLRRLCRHLDPGRVCRAADRSRFQVRPGRILLADGAGPDRRRGAGFRLADQGDRHDRAGPAAGPDRHRREFGRGPLLVRCA